MPVKSFLLVALMACLGTAAHADFQKVANQSQFVKLVSGKTLTRALIELRVTQDGRIEGTGVRWDVTGSWSWQDGYFCRDLFWGGDNLGYNCQEVRVQENRVRFISDKGKGQSAVFRLK